MDAVIATPRAAEQRTLPERIADEWRRFKTQTLRER
jgi:hypothetical protein